MNPKPVIFVLIIIFLNFSCRDSDAEQVENVDLLDVNNVEMNEIDLKGEGDSEAVRIDRIYQSDSVSISLKNDQFNFSVLLEIGDYKTEYHLNQLNVPTLTPELIWVNEDYACLVTCWSQAQVRHVFIPTKRKNEFIYLNKNIESMDSVNNTIVYIDSITDNRDKVFFNVENLLSRKSKTLMISITELNTEFPFYDKISLTKNKVTIVTPYESKSIKF